MLKELPLHLNKLRLSSRQARALNNDPATQRWPQIFFWTEGLILLHWSGVILRRLAQLDEKSQEDFWRGSIAGQLLEGSPSRLMQSNMAQVHHYCRVIQSMHKARSSLIIRARGEREAQQGDKPWVWYGNITMDGRKFVVNEAAKLKSVRHHRIPEFIYQAAKQNDVRFFIRLGKALQSTVRLKDVDWTRCDPLACFLVQNWCYGCDYRSQLPPLCFFSDQALADFCSSAFDRKPGNPSCAAIRQWRRRLGLKQARSPKVKQTVVKVGEILFIEGK